VSGSGVDGATRARLRAIVRAEAARPPQPEVRALLAALRARFGPHYRGALYYGSCRRQTTVEGLVDLHVLVDDPRAALGPAEGRLAEWLPPNVYYLETPHAGETVRAKVAVLSVTRFRRLCTRRGFHSYFWARYAQPLSILDAEGEARRALEESLVDALVTTISRALPLARDVTQPLDFWGRTLALCYNCELRPERGDRSASLVDADAGHHRATGAAALEARDGVLAANDPALARLGWGVRIVWGKVVSLARLLKALTTFDGGLDYAAWKLERHTGRRVEIPEAVRRNPWVHLWPHLWRLWREGTFR
jgi:hypothetical protein